MPDPKPTSEERARRAAEDWYLSATKEDRLEHFIQSAIDAAVAEAVKEQRSAYLAASRKDDQRLIERIESKALRAALVKARDAMCPMCAGSEAGWSLSVNRTPSVRERHSGLVGQRVGRYCKAAAIVRLIAREDEARQEGTP